MNHPNDGIAGNALRALGTLGDTKAIPIVETFTGREPRNWVERQAESALKDLREDKPLVPEEIMELRNIVDDLKSETKKLKEELEDLKKRQAAESPTKAD